MQCPIRKPFLRSFCGHSLSKASICGETPEMLDGKPNAKRCFNYCLYPYLKILQWFTKYIRVQTHGNKLNLNRMARLNGWVAGGYSYQSLMIILTHKYICTVDPNALPLTDLTYSFAFQKHKFSLKNHNWTRFQRNNVGL